MKCQNCGSDVIDADGVCKECGMPKEIKINHSSDVNRPETVLFAGFWLRFAAFAVDLMFIYIIGFILGFAASVPTSLILKNLNLGANYDTTPILLGVSIVCVKLFGLIYYTIFLGSIGRTPGKALMGLKVIRNDGRKPGYGQAFLRTIYYIISFVPVGLGYFWIIWDRNKRGFHDIIAKTEVVRIHEKASPVAVLVSIFIMIGSILALFMTIGYPYARRFAGATKDMSCISNLKKINTAMNIYVNDHNNMMPDSKTWCDDLSHYLPNKSILKCPSYDKPYGYAMNTILSKIPFDTITNPLNVPMIYDSSKESVNSADTVSSLPMPPRHKFDTEDFILFPSGNVEGVNPQSVK
ncbi:MAG: RDD family protein [Patescibacteria group bacterium]|nr:RDD family protein [Patescibacteria group bacterium]